MASGLLIDAFLVRTVLVPAMIALTGYNSEWPGRRLQRSAERARLAPHVVPTELSAPAPAAGDAAMARPAPAAATGWPAARPARPPLVALAAALGAAVGAAFAAYVLRRRTKRPGSRRRR